VVNLVPANLFLSLDSLIVSMAIVMLGTPPMRASFWQVRDLPHGLCAAFMICDGFATLTGLSIHSRWGPTLFSAYLLLLVTLLASSTLRSAWWAPALFSLDNLFAGIAATPSHGSDLWIDSATAAITSGILALIGVAIAAISNMAPSRWVHRAVVILLMAAVCF
jgi:hypothetical protein